MNSKPQSPSVVHGPLGRPRKHTLDVFFAPKNVAVIGATENHGTVGRTVLWNLISSPFGGTVFPVNPKRPGVLGIKAYPNIASVPEPVDLAVIVTPAPSVPGLIGECIAAGVKGTVVISAGFKETGKAGVDLERQILEQVREHGMPVIGPNCLGVMSPLTGLNATFANGVARPGSVGFISQSGALCTAVLDWSFRENVGFSAFLSIGSMLDVDWGDLIDYLGKDPRTTSIVIYMESIGNARSFLSAAREVALTKPIIVIKAGRTEAAAKAAASHTGALTGSDEVLQAAFRRCGVLRVNEIGDLFHIAEVLAKQPRPKGPKLTIVTNAGGPGVLATDALILSGSQLTEVSKETIESLNKILPAAWSHNNPLDVLGDAGPERYAKALEIAAKDPASDGLLVILTPQAMTDATQTAEQLKPFANLGDKPVLSSWMGGASVEAGRDILNRSGIPCFPYPDTAARMFNYMWSYSNNLRMLYETPSLAGDTEEGLESKVKAEKIIQEVRQSGRTILTEFESKQVLAAYGIPTVETRMASTADEAARIAGEMGYPVVLKLLSKTITHKTDVGGVQLNLRDAGAVKSAFTTIQTNVKEKKGAEHFQGVTVQPMIPLDGVEIILGCSIDPQLGPVLLFGSGGQLVEVYKDRSLGLPPLNTTLARRMMEETKVFKALKNPRGKKPVDLALLEQYLVRFSQLVVEQKWISEIDINPLLASAERIIALDARVVVHGKDVTEEKLPKPAIRPYPVQYVSACTMKDGSAVTIRPIRPEDEPLMVKFHESLSDRTVYLRYFQPLQLSQRVSHERLARICFNDFDREIAMVAERKLPGTGGREILSVGRLSKIRGTDEAEFAILVTDAWQQKGLGSEMLGKLFDVGRQEGIAKVSADMLPDNPVMLKLAKKFKIETVHSPEDGRMRGTLTL